jgi:hypothetical protein
MNYEVVNEETDESCGWFYTYDDAMKYVADNNISDRFSVWRDADYCVNACTDFEFEGETDMRVLQGMGLLPKSHPSNQPS